MRKIFVAVLFLSTIITLAQAQGQPDAFGKTITPADLKKHLFIIAGADMEGRETATPGQKKAAAYIESQFRALGLQPAVEGGYQMFFNVYQDTLLNASLEVNGKSFQLDKDFNTSIATNLNATFRFSEVTFISPGISADSIKNMNLAGKRKDHN